MVGAEQGGNAINQSEFLFLPQADLSKCFDKVKPGGHILIYTYDADPTLYDQTELVSTLANLKANKDAHISVLTGPIVVINDSGSNGLLDLKNDGAIELLYARPSSGYDQDFWVVEEEDGYTLGRQSPITQDVFLVGKEHAAGYVDFFDASVKEIEYDPTRHRTNPLLATKSQLKLIRDEALSQGYNFNRIDQRIIGNLPTGRDLKRFNY